MRVRIRVRVRVRARVRARVRVRVSCSEETYCSSKGSCHGHGRDCLPTLLHATVI